MELENHEGVVRNYVLHAFFSIKKIIVHGDEQKIGNGKLTGIKVGQQL